MGRTFRPFAAAFAMIMAAQALAAAELRFEVPEALDERLRGASLLAQAERDEVSDAQELLAAAQADYARLLGALYGSGRYGGTISILVDGREAAAISALDAPAAITRIVVAVEPGPIYRFSQADIGPLAPGTRAGFAFGVGQPARSTVIRETASRAISNWRDAGHAKARVSDQALVADHGADQISARIDIAPGPELRFGALVVSGNQDVRTRRIVTIAGLPEGTRFSPERLDEVAARLRRTGAFRSVALREAEVPNADGTLDITAQVSEAVPRRFGFGAELASREGITLSGFWLHRNLLGGAERFRVEGEIAGIGGDTAGEDYTFGLRYERPATPRADTDLFVFSTIEQLNEPDFRSESFEFGLGFERVATRRMTVDFGLTYRFASIRDVTGTTEFDLLFLPLGVTRETRDDLLDATEGSYARWTLAPFIGSAEGARATGDLRAYRAIGSRTVLAGRLQFGSIIGAPLTGVPNDLRFYSGGGGTVRGQGYQALDVDLGGGLRSGGRSFVGVSAEIRRQVRGPISLVAFADYGYIGTESFPDGTGRDHAGGGLGLRYDTGIGPIRVDLAVPISGTPGGPDFQLYIGIGQAF